MQKLFDEYRNNKNLHHAYIIEGDRIYVYENLCQFCTEDLNIKVKGNADFIYEERDKFIIEDARRIRDLQLNKTSEDSKQIIILSFNFITREAQNALLKVLEEPSERTHFFIIVPSAHIFLDTIISRVHLHISKALHTSTISPLDFINADLKERLEIISKLVTDIKDEKASKSLAVRLVRGIQKELEESSLKNKDYKMLKRAGKLNRVDSYLHDNSASVKILLEYTALSID